MRVSTGMVFNSNLGLLNDRTASLLKTQQQVSSGKRILTPADDPVASSQILQLNQAAARNSQYLESQKTATNTLGMVDGHLSSITDSLARIRELAVQAGNPALSDSDRKSIGTELRSRYDELVGIANTKDGNGQFLFSGYQGTTKPFAGSVETGMNYFGDDGQRELRVSDSRLLPVTVTGNEVFMNIRNGNGVFQAAPQTAAANTGSGVIDAGTVLDQSKWDSSANSGNLQVRFWQDPTTAKTYYDLVDAASGKSLFTDTTSTTGGAGNTFTHAYNSGNAIGFSGLASPYNDFGVSVSITGTPASGDAFTLQSSTAHGLFDMLGNLIKTIEAPASGAATGTLRQNGINQALTNMSQVEDNVLRVRASVGARMNEVTDLGSLGQGLDTQYQTRISELQDVDYNKAITDITRTQTELQATQQSFAKISGMSLFNYL